MAKDIKRQKTLIVGAGPVGALAALYAAQRGHDVEVYELRSGASLPWQSQPSLLEIIMERQVCLILKMRHYFTFNACSIPHFHSFIMS